MKSKFQTNFLIFKYNISYILYIYIFHLLSQKCCLFLVKTIGEPVSQQSPDIIYHQKWLYKLTYIQKKVIFRLICLLNVGQKKQLSFWGPFLSIILLRTYLFFHCTTFLKKISPIVLQQRWSTWNTYWNQLVL